MPIFYSGALSEFASLDIIPVGEGEAEAVVELSFQLPVDLPPGFYRPYVLFSFEGVPIEDPPRRLIIFVDKTRRRPRDGTDSVYLPAVRVGSPAAPRLFWTLLTDTVSNGTRGVRAVEDRDHFGLASRILTRSETFIVPRFDPRTGEPFTHRLEPFAPTVSIGDRGDPPNPPLIPFRFPSGSLTVRVKKPDGSADVLGGRLPVEHHGPPLRNSIYPRGLATTVTGTRGQRGGPEHPTPCAGRRILQRHLGATE